MPTRPQVEETQVEILQTLLVRLIEGINQIFPAQVYLQLDLRTDPRVDPLAEMVDNHATHDITTVITEGETIRPIHRLQMSPLLKATTKTTKKMNAIETAFSSFLMASNRTSYRWLLEFLLKFLLSNGVVIF